MYLGIFTNELNNNNVSDIIKAETVEELENIKSNKKFLKIFEAYNNNIENAELIKTLLIN